MTKTDVVQGPEAIEAIEAVRRYASEKGQACYSISNPVRWMPPPTS